MRPKYNAIGVRPYTNAELRQLLRDKSTTEDRGYATPCRIWNGLLDHKGYGKLTVKRRDTRAHRLSWELFVGPIPRKKCVLHHCDQPRCWRPSHLFIGTKPDNNHDRDFKGRTARGEGSHLSQLNAHQILAMRRRYPQETLMTLAKAFGTTAANVGYIVRRDTWKHV